MASKWIWNYGDYELFHSLLLHERRQEFGADYPTFWHQSHVTPTLSFEKSFTAENDGKIKIHANGKGYLLVNDWRYPLGVWAPIKAGHCTLSVRLSNPRGLPAIFAEGDVETDESWKCSFGAPVGCTPEYLSPNDNVEIFKFSYERREPISCEKTDLGWLYDFGREAFGYLCLSGKGEATVYYGESREEALSELPRCITENDGDSLVTSKFSELAECALVFERTELCDYTELQQRAFRYIHIICTEKPEYVWMKHEYLPFNSIGSFECSDKSVKEIFDTSAETFRLCSREFFLDGIKRDRWVWSGDAYQSAMIDRYLYNDPEIIKRTVLSLLGKPPYMEHINTINDYTFYLMITVYDYWYATLDTEFVRRIFDRLEALYSFAVSRLDENGLVCKKGNDWIFIDWAELDKDGPMCAEQILLWKATLCMKELGAAVGCQCKNLIDTEALKSKIYELYYKPELGGFIDGYVSGKNLINRQQNVLALLYDFTTPEETALIMKRVLCNPSVPAITTPYFTFFELLAMCKNGNVKYATDMLSSYWGKMLELGATSIWEAFDPKENGAEHYAMYDKSFAKSLCHAWGAGPIIVLGAYVAGVRMTSPAAETYEVCPADGIYASFKATVPMGKGSVSVEYSAESGIKVISDITGGTLIFRGKSYEIEKNTELFVKA